MGDNVRETSNQMARATWEVKAVGSQRASSAAGSRRYFEEIRAYRYGYETPFIADFFEFSGMAKKRVLEVGVGNGIDAAEMIRNGAIYSGIDITNNHLELTKTYLTYIIQEGVKGSVEKIVEGDLLETKLDGNYDVVYSFGVLHHIAHEVDYLKRIHGLLKNGGELRAAFYSKYSFFNAWLIATWIFRNRMRVSLRDWQSHIAEGSEIGNPVVIKIRSKRELAKLLSGAGFEVIKYGKKGFVQNYLPLLGRLLSPNGRVLDFLARLLGWYHCFICKRV